MLHILCGMLICKGNFVKNISEIGNDSVTGPVTDQSEVDMFQKGLNHVVKRFKFWRDQYSGSYNF